MRISETVFDDHQGRVVIHDSSNAMVNAIRRAMLRDIPMIAFSILEVSQNNTPMPDEMLAHRIGLVPIYSSTLLDPGTTFHVNKSGPGELKSDDIVSSSEHVQIVKGILICPLYEDQSIAFKATCEIGTGKMHARFQRCVAPCYSIRHDGMTTSECFCTSTSPETNCDKCGHFKPSLSIQSNSMHHVFTFETIGGISPKELMKLSLQTLISNLQTIKLKTAQLDEGLS
jgi:hypothetical protein